MTLLFLLVAVFPGQRFANLPTGVMPEPAVWQFTVSHRFLPAVFAPDWQRDPLRAFTSPNVRIALDKLIGDRWAAGITDDISTRELGLRAAWAPLGWLTAYPEVTTYVIALGAESTWFNLGMCAHHTLAGKYAGAIQPRYTTNLSEHFVSLGLGVKAAVLPTWWLGFEAEPVILGDSTTGRVPMNLTIEKEQGWHNFIITIGNVRGQTAPAMLRNQGQTGYSDILDVTKGYFRVGFNILRKF